MIGQTSQPFADLLLTKSATELLAGMAATQAARRRGSNAAKLKIKRENIRKFIQSGAFKDIETFLKTVANDQSQSLKARSIAAAFAKLGPRLGWNENVSLQIAGFGRNFNSRPLTEEEIDSRVKVKDGKITLTLGSKKKEITLDADPDKADAQLDAARSEVEDDIIKSNAVTWSGRAVESDGAYSIYLNTNAIHDNREGGAIDTLLHELSHVVVNSKLNGFVELNSAERAAIQRLEGFRRQAIIAAGRSQGLDVPAKPTDAEVKIISDQLQEIAASESNQALISLTSLEEFVVEVTHNPEVAKQLATLGFGKGTFKGDFVAALKDVWNSIVTLITGVQVDSSSPLAEGFSDSWRLNFSSVEGDAAPELIRSRMIDEMEAAVAQEQYIEEQLELQDLAGTSEDRNRLAAEWPAVREARRQQAQQAQAEARREIRLPSGRVLRYRQGFAPTSGVAGVNVLPRGTEVILLEQAAEAEAAEAGRSVDEIQQDISKKESDLRALEGILEGLDELHAFKTRRRRNTNKPEDPRVREAAQKLGRNTFTPMADIEAELNLLSSELAAAKARQPAEPAKPVEPKPEPTPEPKPEPDPEPPKEPPKKKKKAPAPDPDPEAAPEVEPPLESSATTGLTEGFAALGEGAVDGYYSAILQSIQEKGEVPSPERKSNVGQAWDRVKGQMEPEEFVRQLRINAEDPSKITVEQPDTDVTGESPRLKVVPEPKGTPAPKPTRKADPEIDKAVQGMSREEFVAWAQKTGRAKPVVIDGETMGDDFRPPSGGQMDSGIYWDLFNKKNQAAVEKRVAASEKKASERPKIETAKQEEKEFYSLGGVFRDEVIPTGPGNFVREKSFTAVTRDMDRRGYQLLLDSQFNIKADASRADDLLRILGRQLREAANAGVRVNRATITTALGNLENPFTEDQLNDIARIRLTDPKAASEKRMVYLRLNRAAFRVKQQAALKSLPRAIKKTVREMNEHLTVLQRKISDMVGGDMKLAVDENLGIYLNRSYSIFDLKDKWVQQIRKNTKVMADARRFIKRQLVKDNADSLIAEAAAKGQVLGPAEADRQAAKGLSAADVDNVLESFLAVYKTSPSLEVLSGRIPGQKNLSVLTKRGVIAPEIQRLWGVNDDPETSYGKTVMKLTSLVHHHKFLTEFRKMGLSEGWLRDNAEDLPVGYVKIASEGNERLAPLAGMYGNSEMVEGLYRMFPPRQKPNPVYNIAAKGTALSMAMATVASAAGQVRNYGTGWLKLLSTDNFNLNAIGKGHSLAIQDNFKNYKDRDKARNAIEELIQLGIFGESVSVNLVENLMNDMQSLGRAASTKGPEKFIDYVTKPVAVTWDFAKGTYAMSDNIFKAIIYFSELEKYRKAFPKMPEAELKKKAAQIARDIHWTYSLAPEWVQELKRGPGLVIAPFITFTTEVVRTNVNTLKLAYDEIKSGNPELAKLGWRRVAGFSAAWSMPSIVGGAFMAMTGLSSDDEEDLREFLPDWQKNNQLILVGRKDGKVSFVDVSFADPNDYFKKPLWAFWRAIAGAEDITTGLGKAAAGTFMEAVSPFASEQLLAGSLMDIARNTDDRGQRVYNPQDSTANILKSVGTHVGDVFVPGTLRSADRIYKGFTGQVTESGRAYDPVQEIAAVVLGQRINEVDLSQSAGFAGSAYMREMRDASAIFNRVFLSNGTQAPGAVAEALRLTNEARERIAKKYHRKYLAARSLGLSQTAFRDRLRAVGVGEDNTEAVMSGEIPPYVPARDAMKEAERRGLTDRIRETQ